MWWHSLVPNVPVSQSRNYRAGLCLVASLKILVIFFTKSLVSYGAQDTLNILLCKNHVACFCRHPPECFPVFKSNVFVPFCPMPTHTSWDKRVKISPELQPNSKNFLKIWWSPPPQWFNFAYRIPFLYVWNSEEGLRNYKLAQIYFKWERALTQRLRHCCGSFSASWRQTFHDQLARPLNLLSFCKMAIPVAHPCFQWGYSEHRVHK